MTNSTDVDEDVLTYHFELYADQAMSSLIASSGELVEGMNGVTSWTVASPLTENSWVTWRAVVTDEHGLSTTSDSASIFINTVNDAPSVPGLVTPADNSEITTLSTELVASNASDPEAEPVTYFFELDTVNTFDSVNLRRSTELAEGLNQTRWFVDNLLDNTSYFWRVKASDGRAQSAWMNGEFFVNTVNDPPGKPQLENPADNGWAGSMDPTLTVVPAVDIDNDVLSYEFEIYTTTRTRSVGSLLSSFVSQETFWQVAPALPGDGWYAWRARAIDEHGLAGEWTAPALFYADSDGVNDVPRIKLDTLKRYVEHKKKLCDLPAPMEHRVYNWNHKNYDLTYSDTCREYVTVKWDDFDPDSNAFISLYYSTSNKGEGGTLIVDGLREDPDRKDDQFKWDISALADGVYFVYAVIDDGTTRKVRYSPNAIVVGDGAGQPYLEFSNTQRRRYIDSVTIKWDDIDSDDNARIALFYDTNPRGFNGTLIVRGIDEDPDRSADKYLWDASALPEGKYYIYAIIHDGTQRLKIYSPVYYKIKH